MTQEEIKAGLRRMQASKTQLLKVLMSITEAMNDWPRTTGCAHPAACQQFCNGQTQTFCPDCGDVF